MTARDTFDLTISRTIRAPRQKVFDAFIKPELVRQWFTPRGFTITDVTIDPRAGGRYRVTMQPRSGTSETVGGEYREVVQPGAAPPGCGAGTAAALRQQLARRLGGAGGVHHDRLCRRHRRRLGPGATLGDARDAYHGHA